MSADAFGTPAAPAAWSITEDRGTASPKMNRPPKKVSDRTQSRTGLISTPNLSVWRPETRTKFWRTWKALSTTRVGRMKSLPNVPKPPISYAGPKPSVG